jgi:hypothetical protein
MLRVDQGDRRVFHFVHNSGPVSLMTESWIQGTINVRRASKLALNVRSVPAPSGMSCGSKANTRSLKRVPVTLSGVASARGSCDIVCGGGFPLKSSGIL